MARPVTAGSLWQCCAAPSSSGQPHVDDVYEDDVSYVRDLGLIARGKFIEVANPIYREVIMRVLGAGFADKLVGAGDS
jgi:hypothetical protein